MVEIKPRAFEHHPQLLLRKAVAENYITRNNLDWKFKVVFDDEIILTYDQLQSFETCISLPSDKAMCEWFTEYCHRIGHTFPDNMLTNLIVSGPKNLPPNWKKMKLL